MKKLRKLLAAVSAVTICAVSITPFVSNAMAWAWEEEITPYTVSFTDKKIKYILNEEISYKFDEEDMKRASYKEPGEPPVTCYDGGMNFFLADNGNHGIMACYYRRYRYEDGTTKLKFQSGVMTFLPYWLTNDTERETLINYLEDNDIPYEAEEYPSGLEVSIYPDPETPDEVFLKALIDIEENTGFSYGVGFLDQAIQVTDVENALPEKTLDGDANEDGTVDIADASAIIQHIGNPGKYGLTIQGMANADCYNTGDGVTGMDAIAIQKLEAGLIASFNEA